ncbi:MAG: SCP-2 sterol transfer family protein [Gammaproteobacteria bacterium]|nr:SCP-2 sterol transfer family protein [Gammaproteobacteria bacterium]
MAEIFSEEWMVKYKSLWNADKEHIKQLADSDFSSKVGFGLQNEDAPRVLIEIDHGIITNLASYNNEVLDWDLRGKPDFWTTVSEKAPNLMRLGLAYTSRDLKFFKGDYATMVKDSRLSDAFIRCIKFMSSVYH